MPITTHVTSLELSRRLKELKVPQNTYFRWLPATGLGDAPSLMPRYARGKYPTAWDNGISAYLASELGEMLPQWYPNGNVVDQIPHMTLGRFWRVNLDDEGMLCSEKTEADARAKMLIYLLENHLISVEKLGK